MAGEPKDMQGATPAGSGCRPTDRAATRPAPAGFHPSREALAQALYATTNHLVSSWLPAGWVPRGLHEDPMTTEVHYAYADAVLALLAQGGETRRAETGTGSVHEHPVPAGQAPDQISDPEEGGAAVNPKPQVAAGWPLWNVTVAGYGTEIITAPTRGKALSKAWCNDVFDRYPFGDFLRICRVTKRREPVPREDDGYDYIRRAYGVDPTIGQRLRLRNEGPEWADREGTVLYPGRSTAHVHVVMDGEGYRIIVHPDNVILLPDPSHDR